MKIEKAEIELLFWVKLSIMKQYLEKVININRLQKPEKVAVEIEQVASTLHEQGWFFVHAITDEMMETTTLFFERDVLAWKTWFIY